MASFAFSASVGAGMAVLLQVIYSRIRRDASTVRENVQNEELDDFDEDSSSFHEMRNFLNDLLDYDYEDDDDSDDSDYQPTYAGEGDCKNRDEVIDPIVLNALDGENRPRRKSRRLTRTRRRSYAIMRQRINESRRNSEISVNVLFRRRSRNSNRSETRSRSRSPLSIRRPPTPASAS